MLLSVRYFHIVSGQFFPVSFKFHAEEATGKMNSVSIEWCVVHVLCVFVIIHPKPQETSIYRSVPELETPFCSCAQCHLDRKFSEVLIIILPPMILLQF